MILNLRQISIKNYILSMKLIYQHIKSNIDKTFSYMQYGMLNLSISWLPIAQYDQYVQMHIGKNWYVA